MYQKGFFFEQNYDQALEMYKAAARHGSSMGEYNLGVMYLEGNGVSKDVKKAEKLFYQSCQQGNELGCLGYGQLRSQHIRDQQAN